MKYRAYNIIYLLNVLVLHKPAQQHVKISYCFLFRVLAPVSYFIPAEQGHVLLIEENN